MSRIAWVLLIGMLLAFEEPKAQTPDYTFSPSIGSPQLYMAGNQQAYPIIRLNSTDQMELHFDDLDGNVKDYYYTFVLCNEDWTPADVSVFDYIKGFSQIRIDNYHLSSVALTRYTHFQAVLPDPNCMPAHSGNYLLKVYTDGDTSHVAFTRRFLVTDAKVTIQSQMLEPQNFDIQHTYQHIQLRLNTSAINPPNPLDQIKVVVVQNYRWDNCVRGIKPTLYMNNSMEYNNPDDVNFEGGNEWRAVDIQSFRYQSDRVQNANYGKNSTDIFLKPDPDRSQADFRFYKDMNGYFVIQTADNYNPLWQTDYATVHFSFVPRGNSPFPDKDVYLLGKFTGGGLNDSTLMVFNPDHGRYERNFLVKQGFYSYSYVTVDKGDQTMKASFSLTEGNHEETENDYMILVYYRPLGSLADELVGIARFNSLTK
jgi:hypothetical protein